VRGEVKGGRGKGRRRKERERLFKHWTYLHTGTTDNLRRPFSINIYNNAQQQLIFLHIMCLYYFILLAMISIYLDNNILLKNYPSFETFPLLLKISKLAKSNKNDLPIS
jgi:hypothetical protein